ncbi:non-specific serine/threonine protein kinase [Enhydrobacter aerosaccus]|uniref:Non-specific serine/threonine protein kinase n=1 Tax=Enhydrobacter aerosaccus TaxID=225324 RepID=A0A1T4SNF4_9HYPH|nr:non-specific serine/threonine protein kinase [Enhydrobacter aerosaccus]
MPIGGRAFDVLQALVEAAGIVVTKSDLMGRIWPNSIVGDNALQVHVSAIRKALGADRRLLKTVSGRGYRLLGDWTVRRSPDAADPHESSPAPLDAPPSASHTYRSGDCEIDLAQRELRIHGASVPLGGRAFDLLAALVEGANELVTRDQLIERVWPGVSVKEGAIEFHISAIRKALGAHRAIIKTISGRGYRLIGAWSRHHSDQPRSSVSAPGATTPTNLPATKIDLVGRDASLEYLQQACSAYRLVTLTGTGGIGKTALGIELARSLLPAFDGNVWLVELASLADPNLVPLAVAEAVGLPTDRGAKSADSVARDIGGRRLLLVLDNCEHLIDAATQLAESILRLSSRAVIVATSRETLRTNGEHVYRVPPLDVPPHESAQADEILGNSAVQLFLDRAEATHMVGLRDRQNLRLIANICRHLDGMPLAIEFAAARAASLGLARVADGLQDRFALLTTGRRTALPRHQTLRAVLDWSYALLPDAERLLLHRLAIFTGGFSFDAACAVMREHSPADVADGIASLVEKSVVNLEQGTPNGRWRLLETVRSYAMDKLNSAGEYGATARRHADYFRDFFATFAPPANEESASSPLASFTREVDNLRAALTWAFSAVGDPSLGGRLTAAAVHFWLATSLLDECRNWVGKALANMGDSADLEQEMVLRNGLGQSLMFTEGMTSATHSNLTRALSLAEAIGSIEYQKRAVHGLWQISLRSVELRKALQLSRRYAAFARNDADLAATRTANLMVGMSLTYLAEYVEASRLLEHAIHDHPVAQHQGEMASLGLDGLTSAFGHLSTCLLARGLIDASISAAERSIEEAQQTGQPVALCLAMTRPAGLLFPEIGAFATAERYIAAILELADRHALHTFRALATCANGRMLFMRGDPASGTTALRSGLAQMEATGYRSLQTIFRGYFAEALTAVGNADEGLAEAEAALRFAEQTEYMRFVPELLCIHGRVIAHSQPDNPKVEQILRRAIDLSRRQGALYWELRAALALAELWQVQGHRTEAHALLSPLYQRFTEGLTTPILARANTLLQETSDGR